jgi:hypothetical protein
MHKESSLTAVFTGPPSDIGFQENPGSAAPVQHLLGAGLIPHFFLRYDTRNRLLDSRMLSTFPRRILQKRDTVVLQHRNRDKGHCLLPNPLFRSSRSGTCSC